MHSFCYSFCKFCFLVRRIENIKIMALLEIEHHKTPRLFVFKSTCLLVDKSFSTELVVKLSKGLIRTFSRK